ncbi:VOC family protein [Palleronia rufa]|uniref:VOC family protein n=1 Tax=Palleronia rufa TaxID=1530186 RepID=UPI00055C9059|nr:VOC family protein [Palleronia rufa]
MTTSNTCVWFEIPVTDLERARTFYSALMGRDLETRNGGPNPIVALTGMDDDGVSGHLYPGTPAAAGSGPTIHLAAPDGLDTAAARIRENGGTVVSDPIEIPAGTFFYATDPDGNSIGLFA